MKRYPLCTMIKRNIVLVSLPMVIVLVFALTMVFTPTRTLFQRFVSSTWCGQWLNLSDVISTISWLSMCSTAWTIVVWVITDIQIRKHFIDPKALPCPRCLYDLSGVSLSGNCPECGLQYDAESVIEHWSGKHQRGLGREFKVVPRKFTVDDLAQRQRASAAPSPGQSSQSPPATPAP